MTNQQLFDTVATHLLLQGRKSLSPGVAMCLYRGSNGTKCAIGILIPDKVYSLAFEGQAVDQPLIMAAAGLSEAQRELAYLLQRLHDGNLTTEWPTELRSIASRLGLSYRVVDDWEAIQRGEHPTQAATATEGALVRARA